MRHRFPLVCCNERFDWLVDASKHIIGKFEMIPHGPTCNIICLIWEDKGMIFSWMPCESPWFRNQTDCMHCQTSFVVCQRLFFSMESQNWPCDMGRGLNLWHLKCSTCLNVIALWPSLSLKVGVKFLPIIAYWYFLLGSKENCLVHKHMVWVLYLLV